ncbi:MAG: hypothetical protein U0836_27005 [Pirellulales bacterium]
MSESYDPKVAAKMARIAWRVLLRATDWREPTEPCTDHHRSVAETVVRTLGSVGTDGATCHTPGSILHVNTVAFTSMADIYELIDSICLWAAELAAGEAFDEAAVRCELAQRRQSWFPAKSAA